MAPPRRPARGASRGQAAIELLAGLPLLLAAALIVWQLAAMLAAAHRATASARAAALAARGAPAQVVVVERSVAVPAVLPGVGPLRIRARTAVRAP
jgi:hypothetical protein